MVMPAPQLDLSEDLENSANDRAQQAASHLGLVADAVERLPFDLSALESGGIFINVDAQGFGMLDRRLDWQALGVTLPRHSDLAFRPPHCALLPDRFRLPLLRPAQRAHTALHRYSYHFRFIETLFETPAYRFVPCRAFETFEAEFSAARAALEKAKTEVVDEYDAVREEIVETFLRLAEDSARRLEATGHAVPEDFQGSVLRGVLSVFPSLEALRDRLSIRYKVGVLQLGSEMLAEQRKAAEERQRLEETEAAGRLTRLHQQAQERAVQEQLWVEQERVRRRIEAEDEERQREAQLKERLRQLKIEAARERLQEAMSPLEEGAKQLHAAVYQSAVAIQAALQKHGHLPGATARKAKQVARWFRLMRWESDQELDSLIGELEALAQRPKGQKARHETGELQQVLGDIVQLCYADARALTEPSRMGALEL